MLLFAVGVVSTALWAWVMLLQKPKKDRAFTNAQSTLILVWLFGSLLALFLGFVVLAMS